MEKAKQILVEKKYLLTFILITSLFALWGFANDITNPMVAAFQTVMELSATKASLVQFAFYGGYATMALPAALFVRKYSYKKGILLGLALYAIGAFLFIPAAEYQEFSFFCVSLYVLTFGLAFLETTSNPYILSLGKEHIRMVGPLATLNANYVKESLKDVYTLPIPTVCKHEFVFDGLKDKSTGVTTMDVAKRLLDYGYHAPTIYFPLLFHEAMMIEPTESESKETIDAFIEVLRLIADEAKNNPEEVKTAPHNTPVGRVDDVLAAKHPILTWKQMNQ